MNKRFLLVNPWIEDFAAFNLWMRPLGLLSLAAVLRDHDVDIAFMDLLHVSPDDVRDYNLPIPDDRGFGQGRFRQELLRRPEVYSDIKRKYRRFGISWAVAEDKLNELETPDAIFLTSGMTYWYTGVEATVDLLKDVFPDTPVYLGGVYASLCTEHARKHTGADHVLPGPWEKALTPVLENTFGLTLEPEALAFKTQPFIANDLYPETTSAVMRFTRGCPFSCSYCASGILDPGFEMRDPQKLVEEICWNARQERFHIALYDDALLVNADNLLIPVLMEVLKREMPVTFHTPNGIHAKYITADIAKLFQLTGFTTVRLSFEALSGAAHTASDGKAEPNDLKQALRHLHKAGYDKGDIEVYMLVAIPGQTDEEIKETARFINSCGGYIRTTQYSPIPGTPMFEEDIKRNPAIADEPLLHNSTIAAGWDLDVERLDAIKTFVTKLNRRLVKQG